MRGSSGDRKEGQGTVGNRTTSSQPPKEAGQTFQVPV
jgi:hypothetical protein